jgi:hypothetical protein
MWRCWEGVGGAGSGSGFLIVVPLDSGGLGEHFGGKMGEIGVVLSEL